MTGYLEHPLPVYEFLRRLSDRDWEPGRHDAGVAASRPQSQPEWRFAWEAYCLHEGLVAWRYLINMEHPILTDLGRATLSVWNDARLHRENPVGVMSGSQGAGQPSGAANELAGDRYGLGRLELELRRSPAALTATGPESGGEATTEPEPEGEPKPGMTVKEAADRLERLRAGGEKFSSQKRLAEAIGCSASTVNKALRSTELLHAWSAREKGPPRAVSLNDVVTDRRPQNRELSPDEEADIRMFRERMLHEKADPKILVWFDAQPVEDQLEFLSDPDRGNRVLGRKA